MHFKTADLCDAHSDKIQILSPGLLNYGGKPQFCGRIVTLKLFEDNSLLRDLLGEAGDDQVIVVDGGGSLRCALLGDMLANKAVENGWRGISRYILPAWNSGLAIICMLMKMAFLLRTIHCYPRNQTRACKSGSNSSANRV